MRALVAATLLVTASVAHADGNLELAGGISIPTGDNNWKNIADVSPKLGVRIGDFFRPDYGVMLQADWTPVSLNNSGASFGIGDAAASAHVFRILIDFAAQHHVTEHIVISGRAGIGIDLAHASATVTIPGVFTGSRSDTDAGLAVEFGGGVWYDFGGTQVGGEIALPIGNHSAASENGSIAFQYAMYDIDLLAGVRLRGF
ncbi:MAG TPA: hypothetical protein VH143_04150 [Kofleriaceae bacterium]|jgi:hypothetical protein|nr:hypothetical protein [Kofleriaceae bacterium]